MGVDVMRIETENVGQNDTDQEFILWLYQEFYRLMFYTAQKYVANQKQQEDIVQESLRKLIEKTPRLRRFQRPVLGETFGRKTLSELQTVYIFQDRRRKPRMHKMRIQDGRPHRKQRPRRTLPQLWKTNCANTRWKEVLHQLRRNFQRRKKWLNAKPPCLLI